MKEGCVEWEGKLLTFRYQVREYFDFTSATVWDKNSNSFDFHRTADGNFICPTLGSKWPHGLIERVAEVLKTTKPEPLPERKGFMWEKG